MDYSFLTFSPKALLRKRTVSKKTSSSYRSNLTKSKICPHQDVGSPSNLKNVTKSNTSPPGGGLDSSIIILDDPIPVCHNFKKRNSVTYCKPVVSNVVNQACSKINMSDQNNGTIILDNSPAKEELIKRNTLHLDQSTPEEKFDKIKEWLDELHNVHQQKMYQPLWSTPFRSETCSLNSNISSISKESSFKLRISETSSNDSESASISGSKDKSKEKGRNSIISSIHLESLKLRISEISGSEPASLSESKGNLSKESGGIKDKVLDRSTEEINKPTLRRKLVTFSSDSESDSTENNSLNFKLKSKLKILSSDSDSCSSKSHPCSNSNSCSSSGCNSYPKSVNLAKHLRSNVGSYSEENDKIKGNKVSETSAGRICSELYGDIWDKENVITPKPGRKISSKVREEEPRKSSNSVNELLNKLYGNSWCREKVLTPLISKRKTQVVGGKENTPPLTENRRKVKRKLVKHNVSPSTPCISPANLKTVKSTKGVKVASSTLSRGTLSFLRSLSASPSSSSCNPRALLYKKEFKKNKEALCQELFKLYNSEVFENKLPSAMKIEWNVRMNRTAGFCYNSWIMQSEGKVRSSRIELSTKVCSTTDRVRDTLIHELCHAATWVINGVKNGHGPQWKAWTLKAMKKFPELPAIGRCHSYDIETKFTYKCKSCGYSIGRHSKSLDLQRKRCGHCYGEFELFVNSKPRRADPGIPSTPRTPRAVKGFALFVKQNYKTTKEAYSGLSHAEIMKLLGSQFSSVKENTNQ